MPIECKNSGGARPPISFPGDPLEVFSDAGVGLGSEPVKRIALGPYGFRVAGSDLGVETYWVRQFASDEHNADKK